MVWAVFNGLLKQFWDGKVVRTTPDTIVIAPPMDWIIKLSPYYIWKLVKFISFLAAITLSVPTELKLQNSYTLKLIETIFFFDQSRGNILNVTTTQTAGDFIVNRHLNVQRVVDVHVFKTKTKVWTWWSWEVVECKVTNTKLLNQWRLQSQGDFK